MADIQDARWEKAVWVIIKHSSREVEIHMDSKSSELRIGDLKWSPANKAVYVLVEMGAGIAHWIKDLDRTEQARTALDLITSE